jgi:hypothetical protein
MRRKDGSIFFASGVSAPLRAGAVRGSPRSAAT